MGPWILSFVFLVSGIAKAIDPQPTEDAVGLIVGWRVQVGWLVALLVCFEIVLAAWLVSGLFPRAALGSSILVLVGFSAALAILLAVNPTTPCGCGMPVVTGNTLLDNYIGLGRNVLLIVIAALAWPLCKPGDTGTTKETSA